MRGEGTQWEATGVWYPGAHVDERGDHPALVSAATARRVTYGDLDTKAMQIAAAFHRLGCAPGDHVALWFDSTLEFPAYWWGAHYAGLRYSFISARLTSAEAAYIVEDSTSVVAVLDAPVAAEHLSALRDRVGPGVRVFVDDNSSDGFRSLLDHEVGAPPTVPAGAPMLYSSGTTGQPKGIWRPEPPAPLGTNPGVALAAMGLFGMTADSVYLSPAPLYHAGPYGFVAATTAIGATAVIMDHFDAEGLLQAIEQHGVTHIQLVPTMFSRLLALPDAIRQRYDLSSLQAAFHAAAPCPIPVKEQMLQWWGPVIHEYYSGTEGAGFAYCSPTDWLSHKGTVGRVLLGQAHVLDEHGTEVPVGEEGALYFSGGAEFEYHQDPDKTRASRHPEGWTTFGDIGRIDADGFIYLTDRRSNLILVGGVNVYPQETENRLITHAAVYDAAVIGIPHHDLGEQVHAVVQLEAGNEPGARLEAELMAYCRQELAAVKCPKTIEFRAELPREPNGKLLKRLLRDEYR